MSSVCIFLVGSLERVQENWTCGLEEGATYVKGIAAFLTVTLGPKTRDANVEANQEVPRNTGILNNSRYGEREVRSVLKEADVALYAKGTFDRYVSTHEESLGPELLSSLAEPTGGRAFTISNINDLPDVAGRIATELRIQYVLAYRPSDTTQDGKWHKIHVKLRMPRRLAMLQAHAKAGYYAQAK
jgi:VWFA-related protein